MLFKNIKEKHIWNDKVTLIIVIYTTISANTTYALSIRPYLLAACFTALLGSKFWKCKSESALRVTKNMHFSIRQATLKDYKYFVNSLPKRMLFIEKLCPMCLKSRMVLPGQGVKEVELNVWEFNQDAISFYEKLGYTTVSRKMWRSLN